MTNYIPLRRRINEKNLISGTLNLQQIHIEHLSGDVTILTTHQLTPSQLQTLSVVHNLKDSCEVTLTVWVLEYKSEIVQSAWLNLTSWTAPALR